MYQTNKEFVCHVLQIVAIVQVKLLEYVLIVEESSIYHQLQFVWLVLKIVKLVLNWDAHNVKVDSLLILSSNVQLFVAILVQLVIL